MSLNKAKLLLILLASGICPVAGQEPKLSLPADPEMLLSGMPREIAGIKELGSFALTVSRCQHRAEIEWMTSVAERRFEAAGRTITIRAVDSGFYPPVLAAFRSGDELSTIQKFPAVALREGEAFLLVGGRVRVQVIAENVPQEQFKRLLEELPLRPLEMLPLQPAEQLPKPFVMKRLDELKPGSARSHQVNVLTREERALAERQALEQTTSPK
jgi:hypothetical protein